MHKSVSYQKVNILEFLLLSVVVSLSLWPSYLLVKFQGLPSINLTRILIFLALVMWGLSLFINQSYRLRLINSLAENKNVLLLLIIPFFVWKLVTAGLSYNLIPALFSASKDTIYYFGLFILSLNIFRTPSQIERLVKLILLTSFIIFLLTFIEVINQQNLFVNFVPDSFVSAARLREGIIRDTSYRAWGTFSHPIALAGYCTTVLPLVAWYAVTHRAISRWFSIFVCVLLVITIFFSRSRSGIAVLLFMANGFFIVNYVPSWVSNARFRKKGAILFSSLLLMLIFLSWFWLVGQKLVSGRTTTEAKSSSIRVLQMELGRPLIQARPLVGYGPGEAADVLGLTAKTVDNYYLSMALESGVPEVILFIAVYLYFLSFAWKLQKKLSEPYRGLAVAIFWLIMGNVLFLTVVSLEQTLPFVFLMFGLLIPLKSIASTRNAIDDMHIEKNHPFPLN